MVGFKLKDLAWAFCQLFLLRISLLAIQGIIQWIGAEGSFPILWIILLGALFLADIILNPIVNVLRLQLNEKILTH